ncbi:MAG: YggS family pyridoxal phosphate-dependent enzyme [Clostridia bacterium]|nr:YggS family pyridoxal phosphate-dependent enzyme [Clostridia bacterium]
MGLEYIERNAEFIRRMCAETAREAGVPVPRIVAVTKSATAEEVAYLCNRCGQKEIAENRVSLFLERLALFAPGQAPAIHLIGSLQTNKVKYITDKAYMIQSLDSLHLAEEIEKQAVKKGVTVSALVEINSGREANKGGVNPEEAFDFAEAVRETAPHIRLSGLMTMGPVLEKEEEYTPYFRATKTIFDQMKQKGLFGEDAVLSMGMSNSFAAAIREGATMVRIGRAFFRKPLSEQ